MKSFVKLVGVVLLSVSASAVAADKVGEKIYQKACVTCHGAGIAGAPKPFNKKDWQPRFKAAESAAEQVAKAKGTKSTAMDVFVTKVKKGMGAMPAGGMCNGCSDSELKAAIEYMTSKLK